MRERAWRWPVWRRRLHAGRRQATLVVALALIAAMASGCGAARSYRSGQQAAAMGDWDTAVAHYRQALQDDPDRTEYKIALERAMQAASLFYLERARRADEAGDLETAVAAYRKVYEYDPGNRNAMLRAAEIDRLMRDRAEAARPRPPIEAMRETARQRSALPTLDPTSQDPIAMKFVQSGSQDVITFLGSAFGINVVFEQAFQSRQITIDIDGLTLEEALAQVMAASGTFYKIINPKTIMVIPDTPPKRTQYEELVVRTFYLSHADATEVLQTVQNILQIPNVAAQPRVLANKTQNSLTVRASHRVMNIIEQIIRNNDRPRAEIVIDVEILEVNRARARDIGLNLSQYAVGSIFSPEAPPGAGAQGGGVTTAPFNLNTITRGISAADFYLTVPQAVVNFLASDSTTKIIAKPQMRGMEGQELTLDLGDEIPVPSTTFGGFAGGGLTTIPINQFTYRTVGVKLRFNQPRVTLEGEIISEMEVESSTLGGNINVAGQSLPTFGTRRVKTVLRLREGESHMLAGLIREDQRRDLIGFPGILRTPLLRRLFGSTSDQISQTDIVFLLTPRLVRTSEVTQDNLDPIYIGSQQNLGLTGPPPLIAPPEGAAPGPDGAAVVPQPGAVAQPLDVLPQQPQFGAVADSPSVLPATPPPTVTPPVPPEQVPPVPVEAPPISPAEPAAAAAPAPGPTARITVTTPGPEFQVGGGPYTVPISMTGAQRVATVSLTVTYNPSVLRVRSVQEGSFLKQGGAQASFTQQVDQAAGRVDIAIVRSGDGAGASGSGLLAALVFEPVAAGQSAITPSGVASNPEQGTVGLQLVPATVTVR
jgi:general secretion pathway protein D